MTNVLAFIHSEFSFPLQHQEWFPRWVWKTFEKRELSDAMIVCGIQEKDKEKAERMGMVALWCVQYKPESRPSMSVAVKMLESVVEIPMASNPFRHLMQSPLPDLLAEVKGEACGFPLAAVRMLAESSCPCTAPTI